VPEIEDLRSRVKTLSAFGDFSTIGFTMVGLGEPREVRAGVVGGSYFEVMGLRPRPAMMGTPSGFRQVVNRTKAQIPKLMQIGNLGTAPGFIGAGSDQNPDVNPRIVRHSKHNRRRTSTLPVHLTGSRRGSTSAKPAETPSERDYWPGASTILSMTIALEPPRT